MHPPTRTTRGEPTVVVLSRVYAPEAAAASQRLLALVRGLRSARARVRVLTTRPPASASGPDGSEVGAQVRRWPVLRDAAGMVRGYLPYLSFDLPAAVRLLVTRRVDVVVVEQPPTTAAAVRIVAALRRRPYVYYAGDVLSAAVEATDTPRAVVRVVRAMESWALRGAALVLAPSDGVAQRVRALGGRRVTVVGFGVDTDTFSPIPEASIRENLLVYAGTASEVHGADIFAEAMEQVRREVPDARLVYVGSGTQWPRLRELAAGMPGAAITVRASMSAGELAALLRGARIGLASLVPGQGYDFALATKALSSLATGTPVVFAGVGPTADLVREIGAGEAVAYDTREVAQGLVRVLTSPQESPEVIADRVASGWSARTRGREAAAAVLAVLDR